MNESEMTQQYIQEQKNSDIDVTVYPEVPYNNYGDRGSVDLVIEKEWGNGTSDLTIYEFKSESAVESVTGANEIVRQFNRHRSHFFDGNGDFDISDYTYQQNPDVTFVLMFYASQENILHLRENKEIYSAVETRDFGEPISLVKAWHEDILREANPVHEVWWQKTDWLREFREVVL